MRDNHKFDVIIIGGSFAGLAAALTLGRFLKKTLVIDGGKPCNRFAPQSYNCLTQDGIPPKDISAVALQQVQAYESVQFVRDLAVRGRKTAVGYEITTTAGAQFIGEKLIFSTGIKDVLPDIEGFSDCWGKSIIHCPDCHGYEYRGKKTAIISDDERGLHTLPLIRGLTEKIIIVTSNDPVFSKGQLAKLKQHKVRFINKTVNKIEHEEGYIKNLVFEDGSREDCEVVYSFVPFVQNTTIPESLGCTINEFGYIDIDDFQRTSVANIFACGDCASSTRSVSNAIASGNLAGSVANYILSNERF